MQHYKKLITVFTVTFLMLSLFVSQAFAVQYNYRLLEDYNNSVLHYYWNFYDDRNTKLSQSWIIPSRDPTNNRFTASIDISDKEVPEYVHRFDLIVRFNSTFTFEQGDNVTYKFFISSKCQLNSIDDINGYVPSTYWLQFFRVWYEDDTTFVFYPEHQYCTSNKLNDTNYTIVQGTLQSAKPRIVSMQFSFNLSQGVNVGNPLNDLVYWNIWFNNSIQCIIDRNTSQNPIYTPEDDTIIKDQQQLEDQIYNDIDDGLNGASDMWGSFGTLVSNDGRLYRGLMFVTNLLNKFLGIEMFSILGTFGLSLGIFAFLIGIAQLIKSSVERKEREQNSHKRR